MLNKNIIETLKATAYNTSKGDRTKIIHLTIDVLENIDENIDIYVEKSGANFNLGVIFESVLKYHVGEYCGKNYKLKKSDDSRGDMSTYGLDRDALSELGLDTKIYEIKTLTGNGANKSAHGNKHYIFIDLRVKTRGVWYVERDNVTYNANHVNGYSKGVRLDLLSDLIGL